MGEVLKKIALVQVETGAFIPTLVTATTIADAAARARALAAIAAALTVGQAG